ncbi:transport and Golgi organization protein 1-like [Oppia nitens]|uniref:transport and Golgi organization protein 1-like n=1 Tax=Oppia nitens TaxID=1686743 RepID=UPI0023DB27E5|nr:transport and Golgi organization protein 1-like [Oppia nitens]
MAEEVVVNQTTTMSTTGDEWTESSTARVISDLIPDNIEMILRQYHIYGLLVVFVIIVLILCLLKICRYFLCSSRPVIQAREIYCQLQRNAYYLAVANQRLSEDIPNERQNNKMTSQRLSVIQSKEVSLKNDLIRNKMERDQLVETVKKLETEQENIYEKALETNRLISYNMNVQKENVYICETIDQLKRQLSRLTETVVNCQQNVNQKQQENLELTEQMMKLDKQSSKLKNVTKERKEYLKEVSKNNEKLRDGESDTKFKLNQLIEEYSGLETKSNEYIHRNGKLVNDFNLLSKELDEFKKETISRELEISSLKETLIKLGNQSNNYNYNDDQGVDQIDESSSSAERNENILNLVKIVSKIKCLTVANNTSSDKLQELSDKSDQLNQQLVVKSDEHKLLKSEKDSALRDRFKAQTELEVLSKYYKQRELELSLEMSNHCIEKQQKDEDVNSVKSRLTAAEEENALLRSQLKSTKKEMTETGVRFRTQINHLENQIHENWIQARSAQRSLEESKAEATVLRQTLTQTVKSPIDSFGFESSFFDDSASSVSDHYNRPFPPIPPPPPLPLLINSMVPSMQLPSSEPIDRMTLWAQSMSQISMNEMDQTFTNDPNVSIGSMDYTPVHPQQHWDTVYNRDSYSPTQSYPSTYQPTNPSAHPTTYNVYTQQPNNYYMNTMPVNSNNISNLPV